MQRVMVKDTSTGQIVVSSTDLATLGTGGGGGSGAIESYNFIVSAGGQTEFSVAQNIALPIHLNVFVNGVETREGVSDDYTRDDVNRKIIFNYTVPADSWVEIEVFDPVVDAAIFDFEVVAPQSQFTLGTLVNSASDIRTTVNGTVVREGISYDFQRYSPANRVDFNYNIPAGAQVRVAIK